MKNKLRQFLACAMALAMAFSCCAVAFEADVADNGGESAMMATDESGVMPLADQVFIATISGSVETDDYTGSFSIPWSLFGTKYTPYISLSPGGQTFCVFVGIYNSSGNLVVGKTYNTVNGNLSGQIQLGTEKLSSGKYTYKVVFDRPLDVVSLNLYANPN